MPLSGSTRCCGRCSPRSGSPPRHPATPPCRAAGEPEVPRATAPVAPGAPAGWCEALPVLEGRHCSLRELDVPDAGVLWRVLSDPEVRRYAAPPQDETAFARFAQWAQEQRRRGRYACFAIVPRGHADPAGVIQLRALDPLLRCRRVGIRDRQAVLGARAVSRRRGPAARLCVRDHRRPSPRGAHHVGQRAGGARAAAARCGIRGHAAPALPPRRPRVRRRALLGARHRLAPLSKARRGHILLCHFFQDLTPGSERENCDESRCDPSRAWADRPIHGPMGLQGSRLACQQNAAMQDMTPFGQWPGSLQT